MKEDIKLFPLSTVIFREENAICKRSILMKGRYIGMMGMRMMLFP